MTRAKKVDDPKHYNLIVDRNTLSTFKKVSRTQDTGPADIMRCLIQNYVDLIEPGHLVEGSVTKKILDTLFIIEDNLNEKNSFLISDLNLPEADEALKSLMCLHEYYDSSKLKSIKNVHISENEYITIAQPNEGTCIITTSAHNCTIHYDGLRTTIEMSDGFNTANFIHKQCIVTDLLRTFARINDHYVDDLKGRLNIAT